MNFKYAAALSTIALLAVGSAARADSNTADHLAAQLTGPGDAKGTLSAEYYPPEQTLAFRINYSGLDGATSAEFDGPDGKPVIQVKADPKFIGGSSLLSDLSEEQREALLAGKWTVKVNGPSGAITGRVAALNTGVNP